MLRELEMQPEWVQLKSQGQWDAVLQEPGKPPVAIQVKWQERRGQVQQEQTRTLSTARKNRIITVLVCFLHERARIEWIGDLYEMRSQWQEQGLSPWVINLRMSAVALQLFLAQLYCTVYDWFFTKYWGRP